MTEQELILTSVLDCRRVDLYVDRPPITILQKEKIENILLRRQSGEPLQYLLGSTEFMGLRLNVDHSVLIPRPETEMLVEKVVGFAQNKNFRILDIGTGSGNIAIALAKFCQNAEITTIEISEEALSVARENAKMHNVGSKIDFIHQDIYSFMSANKFDVIVSNPPYIPSGKIASLPVDVQLEPHGALDGGVDGLDFYRAIIAKEKDLLRNNGRIFLEFGDGQEDGILEIFKIANAFDSIKFIKDLSGTERIVSARKI